MGWIIFGTHRVHFWCTTWGGPRLVGWTIFGARDFWCTPRLRGHTKHGPSPRQGWSTPMSDSVHQKWATPAVKWRQSCCARSRSWSPKSKRMSRVKKYMEALDNLIAKSVVQDQKVRMEIACTLCSLTTLFIR